MRYPSHPAPRRPIAAAARQRGIIMVIALITLALMMIGAVAALRSMNATLSGAGNIGMKRDMSNQVEVALRRAMATLTGAPAVSLWTSDPASNYSATILATTPEGIPTVLLGTSPTTVGGLGVATNVVDLTSAPAAGTGSPPQVTMYYVIDRLCKNTGSVDSSNCLTPSAVATGTDSKGSLPPPTKPVYRVSVRVDGPRGSQSFYQATLTN